MAATPFTGYKEIKLTGPVSVERVNEISDLGIHAPNSWVILIMGPTGAGKSTFIEALGLQEAEKISSNRLEGFTQTISTYTIKNVTHWDRNYSVYLVDSPGFADTKISEMAIVSMLQQWMKDTGPRYFNRIYYLTPITQVRLPGSHRRVLRTFQALTGSNAAKSITIVTTMWDAIAGEKAMARAEMTYKQLEGDVWKEFIDEGAQIVKFHNTQASALSVLDDSLYQWSTEYFRMERFEGTTLRRTTFATNLYKDLQDRIANQQLVIDTIQSDLVDATAQEDQLLQSVLRPKLEEAERYLVKFQMELEEFGDAPDPEEHGKEGEDVQTEIKVQRDEEARSNESPTQPNSAATQGIHAAGQLHQPHRARLSRALDFVMGCRCCGKSVQTNHDV